MKAYWDDGAQMISPHDKNTIAEVNKIRSAADIQFKGNKALIETIGAEIDEQFVNDLKTISLSPKSIQRHHDMKIVYTPIHGTGVKLVPMALAKFGFTNIIHVPEQDVVSGDFPTVVSPNPEEPAALAMAVEKAKEEGYPIYAETCPQYLYFTNEVYKREDGRNFVCSPPMKGEASRKALWDGIKKGSIDTISTDHCPFLQSEKDWGINDFRKIPNGCAGIENMYPFMLAAANSGKITFNKAVEICCSNTARLFGCDSKGSLDIGKDADIVIYDPEKDFTIHNSNMHSDTDHTIWEGVSLHGYPVKTFVRGSLVYDNGEFKGKRGFGRFIKRSPRPKRS